MCIMTLIFFPRSSFSLYIKATCDEEVVDLGRKVVLFPLDIPVMEFLQVNRGLVFGCNALSYSLLFPLELVF